MRTEFELCSSPSLQFASCWYICLSDPRVSLHTSDQEVVFCYSCTQLKTTTNFVFFKFQPVHFQCIYLPSPFLFTQFVIVSGRLLSVIEELVECQCSIVTKVSQSPCCSFLLHWKCQAFIVNPLLVWNLRSTRTHLLPDFEVLNDPVHPLSQFADSLLVRWKTEILVTVILRRQTEYQNKCQRKKHQSHRERLLFSRNVGS